MISRDMKSIIVIALMAVITVQAHFATAGIEFEFVDFVVVGQGTAGAIVATELAEEVLPWGRRWEVVGIEEGPWTDEIPDPDVVHNGDRTLAAMNYGPIERNYTTIPQPNSFGRVYDSKRVAMTGGCHGHNSMLYRVGDATAYDEWGIPGFSHDELIPFIDKVRDRVGVTFLPEELTEFQALLRDFIANSTGYPVVDDSVPYRETAIGLQRTLYTAEILNSTYVRRSMTFDKYVLNSTAFHVRKNLKIHANTRADIILFDAFKNAKVLMAYNKKTQRPVIYLVRKEIILSAGVFDDPKLLMASGIGNATELRSMGIVPIVNLPQVGKNYKYHMAVVTLRLMNPAYAYPTNGTLLTQITNVLIALAIKEGVEINPTGNSTEIGTTLNGMLDIQQENNIVPGLTVGMSVGLNMRDFGPGEVRFNKSNPHVPIIDPKLYQNPQDLYFLVQVFNESRRIMNRLPVFGMEIYPGASVMTHEQIVGFILSRASDGSHGVGTCRMGTDSNSVVTPDFKVRGVNGLRVISASVAPTTPRGNTNAMVATLASKGASMIIAEHN